MTAPVDSRQVRVEKTAVRVALISLKVRFIKLKQPNLAMTLDTIDKMIREYQ